MEVEAHGSVAIRTGPQSASDLRMEVYHQRLLSGDVYLGDTALVDPAALAPQARQAAGGAVSLLQTVEAVTGWLQRRIVYERGYTSVFTTAEEAIARGHGVCQDYAHAAIGLLRALGIPARYVSGLLVSQVGETHAWIEFLHPDHGWLAADPTRATCSRTPRNCSRSPSGATTTTPAPASARSSHLAKAGWCR